MIQLGHVRTLLKELKPSNLPTHMAGLKCRILSFDWKLQVLKGTFAAPTFAKDALSLEVPKLAKPYHPREGFQALPP